MLYRAGVTRRLGRVDHKDAFLDTDALEKARGITIFSKQALLTAGDTDITLLDTPGHVDFSGETERTLPVLDAAILVVSGTDGVQGHTRTLWRLLRSATASTSDQITHGITRSFMCSHVDSLTAAKAATTLFCPLQS